MDYRETKTDDGALPVLYADAQIAVVDKPAGVMAHDSQLSGGTAVGRAARQLAVMDHQPRGLVDDREERVAVQHRQYGGLRGVDDLGQGHGHGKFAILVDQARSSVPG